MPAVYPLMVFFGDGRVLIRSFFFVRARGVGVRPLNLNFFPFPPFPYVLVVELSGKRPFPLFHPLASRTSKSSAPPCQASNVYIFSIWAALSVLSPFSLPSLPPQHRRPFPFHRTRRSFFFPPLTITSSAFFLPLTHPPVLRAPENLRRTWGILGHHSVPPVVSREKLGKLFCMGPSTTGKGNLNTTGSSIPAPP